MISVLLVGFGFSAKTFHLPFLTHASSFSVKGVVSSQRDAVKAVLPETTVYSSLSDALTDSAFDLAIITTPNHLHASQAGLALNNGCHVLVEKPFTLSSEDAVQLIQTACQQERKLSVYHNRRFDGDFLTIKQLIAEGELGDIKRVESRFDRFRPTPRNGWRENAGVGSGIFWDLGPHLIDQALQLFGYPDAVSADILTLREGGQSDDTFDVTLHYANNIVKLGSSAFQAGPTLRFDLQGTQGSYRKFYLDPQEAQLRDGLSLDDPLWARTPDCEHGELHNTQGAKTIVTQQGQYLRFFEQLACAIIDNEPLPVDAASVLPVIKVMELAIAASEQQQTLLCS
ncbi:oxidoreductase [Alteromonas sp. D210916BOD_24]|uniref:Gfo/Idh/MocA family oxidoreductase n=1 Tax=Alteromonas sp. D210916BOD_24 TaxID=3157618 RepID=UPI00399CDCDD